MATIRVCVAALACAAVVAAGGVGVTQGSTQRERRRRILQEDSSDSSPRSDSSSSSSGVDLNYIDAQRDKMHAVWSLEKLLLNLVYKALYTVEESQVLLGLSVDSAPPHGWQWWPKGGAPGPAATRDQEAYALESKLGWLIQEICRVVYKISSSVYGKDDPEAHHWNRMLGSNSGQEHGHSPIQLHVYTPIFLPYWPQPWSDQSCWPTFNSQYADQKLHALHDLLYQLKALDFKGLQLIKSVKELLRVLSAVEGKDWSSNRSSSTGDDSSTEGHSTTSKAGKLASRLSKAEKELNKVIKQQIAFVLKVKAVAYANPVYPPPCPSATATATATSTATGTATAQASTIPSASASPLAPTTTATATGTATATASAPVVEPTTTASAIPSASSNATAQICLFNATTFTVPVVEGIPIDQRPSCVDALFNFSQYGLTSVSSGDPVNSTFNPPGACADLPAPDANNNTHFRVYCGDNCGAPTGVLLCRSDTCHPFSCSSFMNNVAATNPTCFIGSLLPEYDLSVSCMATNAVVDKRRVLRRA